MKSPQPPAIILPLVLTCAVAAVAENWPQWRGPTGDGVSPEEDLPIAWDEHSGIAWKCSRDWPMTKARCRMKF